MLHNNDFYLIKIWGSYSGLAAGMALSRALKKVLIINNGKTPKEIGNSAKQQVLLYDTIEFFVDRATIGIPIENDFQMQVASGATFKAKKITLYYGHYGHASTYRWLNCMLGHFCYSLSILPR